MSNETKDAINAGILIGQTRSPTSSEIHNGVPYTVIPKDAHIQPLELLLDRPLRKRAIVNVSTVQSFNDYLERFREDESVIFADPDEARLTGLVDYHPDMEDASHVEHRVKYTCPLSNEWKTWTGADGRKMEQAEFARFIEDNQVDIRTPDGATVLEIATQLEASLQVEFRSGIRLDNGQRDLLYRETIDTGGSKDGKITVPQTFILGIPVFYKSDAFEVTARLRYRISGGDICFWYDLHRADEIKDAAFDKVVASVSDAHKELPIYFGAEPEIPRFRV